MRTRIFLNPSDTQLSGKYKAEAEHVHVILDSANDAFNVILPDMFMQETREIVFYNVPSNGAGNSVTIYAVTGQILAGGFAYHVVSPYDTVTFVSDMRGQWLLSDINSSIFTTPCRFGSVTDNTTIETDGTVVFNGAATYWRDIDFPLIIKTTGVGTPAISTLQGDITMPQWAANDLQQSTAQELVHEWKESSAAYWHVHFMNGSQDATTRYVKWEIEYAWSNINSVLSSNTTISAEQVIPANTPALTHFLVPIATFTPTGGKIGAHVKAKLKRIVASGTAPSVNPFCEMMQLHIECDTVGSRTLQNK
jgi:hypothetical protein